MRTDTRTLRTINHPLVALIAMIAIGCAGSDVDSGGGAGTTTDSAAADSGADTGSAADTGASSDATTASDAGSGSSDVATSQDAGSSAGNDAGGATDKDAGSATPNDVGSSTGSDAGSGTSNDAGSSTGSDAGSTADSGGVTIQLCGGIAGLKCPSGQACELDSCGPDASGKCVPNKQPCPKTSPAAQQCGCDGKTYANACLRLVAGIGKKHDGACKSSGGGIGAGCMIGKGECNTGLYCKGPCMGSGICTTKPKICTKILKPVCGCDGKTYSNACLAASAGVNIKSQGSCPIIKACIVGKTGFCKADEYCAGECDKPGTCKTRPQICASIYAPVCGCDHKTYSNSCTAASKGQGFKAKGACP